MSRSKWAGAILGYVVLVLAGVVVAVSNGGRAAATYFTAIILATLLAAVLVEVSNQKEIALLKERIAMLNRHACCGCGHPLRRHCDLGSADGFGCLDCNCQAVHRLDEPPVEPYLGNQGRAPHIHEGARDTL